MRHNIILYTLFSLLLFSSSCVKEQKRGLGVFANDQDAPVPSQFDLEDIQANGELIVLTLYGPNSYFEFRGEDFGHQFLLSAAYASSIGVSVRVEVCRTQTELLDKLIQGDGDVVAYNLPVTDSLENVTFCGEKEITFLMDTLAKGQRESPKAECHEVAWAVRTSSVQLQASLSHWLKDHKSQFLALSQPQTRRRGRGSSGGYQYIAPRSNPASHIRNLAKGEISRFDSYFKRYAHTCGWDWRLLAAQSYQESAFDPQAVSYMGAMGLMQLMPQTAQSLGVTSAEVFDPATNIRAATRLISQLDSHYSGVSHPDERINFILAAYNAGPGHVDDARRLAKKQGLNENVWDENVAAIVLRMSEPDYYNDPEVRHGYFRGSETYTYVLNIRRLWSEYRDKIR